MAHLPFSATSAQSMSISHSKFILGFMGFNRITHSPELFLIRSPRSSYSRRKLSVKNVASNQKQKLKDSVTQEEGYFLEYLLASSVFWNPYMYIFKGYNFFTCIRWCIHGFLIKFNHVIALTNNPDGWV